MTDSMPAPNQPNGGYVDDLRQTRSPDELRRLSSTAVETATRPRPRSNGAPAAPNGRANGKHTAPLGSSLVALEAERALNGAIIGLATQREKQRAALDFALATIDASHIKSRACLLLYLAIRELDDAGQAVNYESVSTHLRAQGLFDDSGENLELPSYRFLNQCSALSHTGGHDFKKYACSVRDFANAREAEAMAADLLARLQSGDLGAVGDLAKLARFGEQVQSEKGPQGFTAASLMEMDLPPMRWAIPGFLPAGLNIFAGKPKAKKSWFWLQACVAIASGGHVMGQVRVAKGEALYLALEDTPGRLKDRLRKLLCGSPAPTGLHLFTEWKRSDAGGAQMLDRWLTQHPQCRLVVVDTLQVFRPQQSEKGNAYAQDYDAMRALKAVADKHGVAIVAIHHTTKMSAENPFDTISGTFAINGGADALFVLINRNGAGDGETAILHTQGRDLDDQKIALRWDNVTFQWNAEGDAEAMGLSEQRQKILEYLQGEGGGAQIHRLAKDLGMDYDSAKSLLWKMKNDGQVISENGKYRAARAGEGANWIDPLLPTPPGAQGDAPPEAQSGAQNGEKDRLLRLPRLPFTENPYSENFGDARVLEVLDDNGLLDADKILEKVNEVNAVNGVNEQIALKNTVEHMVALKIDLRAWKTARLAQWRDFCHWYATTFPLTALTQDEADARRDRFLNDWPAIAPNCPPWLSKRRP